MEAEMEKEKKQTPLCSTTCFQENTRVEDEPGVLFSALLSNNELKYHKNKELLVLDIN